MTIDSWLKTTSAEFADAVIPSARLDAEVILAHTINRPRTWLHAHGDEQLDPRRQDIADARAELRLERVPVAYIIGHKEFYGRQFKVSPATLIPRPESEILIELIRFYLLENPSDTPRELVDVGTGSGCLGLTAKLEFPDLSVTLLDNSKQALLVAEKNRALLDASARLIESDLLDAYPLRPDIIVANLPYVDRAWSTSPETKNEPSAALYAEDNGLALIKRLIGSTPERLTAHGALILETDVRQHDSVVSYALAHGLQHVSTDGLGLLFSYQD